jgi:serine protease AprX
MLQVGRSRGRSESEQRPQGERGWSLAFHGSGRLGPIATIALVLAALMPATASASGYDPASDMNSMYNTTQYVGATAYWDAGYTGAGVDVALIDTGVAPVEGLTVAGKVINGPDLSLESQNPSLRYLDTNGHGTFMAGLIAGKDSTLTAPYSQAPSSAYRGIAPDARIVSLKVGVADGGVDVSQVIAAIAWVVQHQHDNGMNIRVLNLSYGTNSTQPYEVDPLAFAVEQAWRHGIFVVTATGNSGYVAKTGTLTNPAYDPKIFAVGASDSMDTATIDDDTVPAFSSTGSNDRTPDVVAPGAHLVGLRVPGSYVDQRFAATGYVSDRFFRGSGTSAAAAVAAGEAALVIQQRPTITPYQLKKLFLMTAQGLASLSTRRAGAGVVDLRATLTTPTYNPPAKWNTIAWSTGVGSLESARGSDHLTADGVVLSGEQDIFGHSFNAPAMAVLEATGSSWSGGTWNGSSWSGSSWSGSSWSGSSWSGSSWSGSSWSGSSWSDSTWSGSSWSGSSWSGSSWSGSSWSGSSWSGSSWSESGWSTGSWS